MGKMKNSFIGALIALMIALKFEPKWAIIVKYETSKGIPEEALKIPHAIYLCAITIAGFVIVALISWLWGIFISREPKDSL